MSTRESVLARITAALADVPATETPDGVPVPRSYRRSHAGPDLVALFAGRVTDYRASVIHTTEERVSGTIAAVLAERGAESVVVPEGFPVGLLPEGDFTRLGDAPPLALETLETAGSVLTTAAVAIAVTGTIVLDAGPGQGRRALSLLPDHHLCVVREEQIAGDVPEALSRLDPAAPLTFISGPSATSDIELDRVEGVHGPRTLDVIVVAARPAEEPS
ncbi:LUD domain-containing protein [Streptomyces sp. Je 1-79]|uniref:LutC/YkgG family protein n=1 Tax=Streptomyces sp. Je 1-79 TaxID=2943847 RepID=UPI0021A64CF3|nr:LUD domain-containing protein [Streptomyces sp. Je 1-79]MCT4351827.1 LUD domain-containing protein [Streptomyces sp. Je 1-79]